MSSDSSSVNGIQCVLCLSSIRNKNYATTDDPCDVGSKCCVVCLQGWLARSHKTVIGNKDVNSYTVYTCDGVKIETYSIIAGPPRIDIADFEIIPSAPPAPPAPPEIEIHPIAPPLSSESEFVLIPQIEFVDFSEDTAESASSRASIEIQSISSKKKCACITTSHLCLLCSALCFVIFGTVYAVTTVNNAFEQTWIFILIGLILFACGLVASAYISAREDDKKRKEALDIFIRKTENVIDGYQLDVAAAATNTQNQM